MTTGGERKAALWTFGAGIMLAFVFVIYSAISGRSYSRISLVLYDLAAIVHVVAIFFVAREGSRMPTPRAAPILYTAGFIHTLLAIGLALLSMAYLLGSEQTADLSQLLNVIAPLGAAVIPHAFAVFLGLLCESSTTQEDASGPEEFFRALTDDARRASQTLSTLYTRRAQAVEEEIRQLATVTANITRLGKTADSAVEASTTHITGIEEALSQLTSQVSALASNLQKAYSGASTSVGALGTSAANVAKSITQAAPESAKLANELTNAVETVRKLNDLQHAIVELISATTLEARR